MVLAVKGSAAADVLRAAGNANLAGKLVMDACNPIADVPPVNGVLKFFTTLDRSLMEQLQKEFAAVHFVKAFNSVGQAQFVNPQYKSGKPTMFICGNDRARRRPRQEFWISLAGKPRTWAAWKRLAPLSLCACCGASRDSQRTSGPTPSSCFINSCGKPLSRSPASQAGLARSLNQRILRRLWQQRRHFIWKPSAAR